MFLALCCEDYRSVLLLVIKQCLKCWAIFLWVTTTKTRRFQWPMNLSAKSCRFQTHTSACRFTKKTIQRALFGSLYNSFFRYEHRLLGFKIAKSLVVEIKTIFGVWEVAILQVAFAPSSFSQFPFDCLFLKFL